MPCGAGLLAAQPPRRLPVCPAVQRWVKWPHPPTGTRVCSRAAFLCSNTCTHTHTTFLGCFLTVLAAVESITQGAGTEPLGAAVSHPFLLYPFPASSPAPRDLASSCPNPSWHIAAQGNVMPVWAGTGVGAHCAPMRALPPSPTSVINLGHDFLGMLHSHKSTRVVTV